MIAAHISPTPTHPGRLRPAQLDGSLGAARAVFCRFALPPWTSPLLTLRAREDEDGEDGNGDCVPVRRVAGSGWADFESQEGAQQGCPLSCAVYTIWLQPHLLWLRAELTALMRRHHEEERTAWITAQRAADLCPDDEYTSPAEVEAACCPTPSGPSAEAETAAAVSAARAAARATRGRRAEAACVIRRALRPRRLWKLQWPLKAPQVAEVSGLMDDVCAIATPRALAAAMPMMARRLQRDGARLEQSKSVWTTLSPATRAQIPTGMRVGQAEDAHGHLLPLPLDAHGNEMKTLGGAYGSDFDGVPIGNPTYVQARLASKLDDARSCIRAIDAALAAPGNGGARRRAIR